MTKEQMKPGQNRREIVYSLLDSLEIKYDRVEHPPIFTQEDSELHPVQIDAVIFKNLFLRNKDKSRYYLYSLPLTNRADLTAVAKTLGETRLSFGDDYALQEKLSIQHGAVSFLNAIGTKGNDVSFECKHYASMTTWIEYIILREVSSGELSRGAFLDYPGITTVKGLLCFYGYSSAFGQIGM